MAGLNIATGALSDHDSGVQPLQDSGSGIDATAGQTPVASIVPDNRFSPGDYGPVRDTTAEFAEQRIAGEADCRAAQAAGMSAKGTLNAHYEQDIKPLGADYGDTLALGGGSLEAGAGGGEALPVGYFYDPPRLGAPETYTGNEPG